MSNTKFSNTDVPIILKYLKRTDCLLQLTNIQNISQFQILSFRACMQIIQIEQDYTAISSPILASECALIVTII